MSNFHTQGEWKSHSGDDYVKVYVERKSGPDREIYSVNYPDNQDLANAHLIAAAPKLLNNAENDLAHLNYLEENLKLLQDNHVHWGEKDTKKFIGELLWKVGHRHKHCASAIAAAKVGPPTNDAMPSDGIRDLGAL